MTEKLGNTRIVGRVDQQTAPVNYSADSVGSTTPSVDNIDVLVFKNTGPVTVTNLLKGYTNQLLRILGDGNTTMKNNTVIKTNTGADKLLAANKVYTFSLINSVWVENA